MKQLRSHLIVATLIISIYVVLAFWFDRTATAQHEEDFNVQQALQTQLSAQSIEDHYEWLQGELTALATYTLPHYIYTTHSTGNLATLFEASAHSVYPDEELVLGYYTDPETPVAVYRHPDPPDTAGAILHEWLTTYWDTAHNTPTLFVTPFTVIDANTQVYGMMLPVYTMTDQELSDTPQGILIAMLNFAPIIERYVIPVRSGEYGAAWVQDDTGLVIYDHEPATVGTSVFEISEPYPDLRRVIDAMMVHDSGLDEYHYTVELGGEVKRKLVAWSTAYLGDQRLTVALSAPDSEINANMTLMRGQIITLGILLIVALVASNSLIYLHRQRTLTGLVTERTQDLENLTNQLEQRVTERTHELEQERAQLTTILEAMTDGVIFRRGAQIIYANARLSELTGYSNQELLTYSQTVFQSIFSPFNRSQFVDMDQETPQSRKDQSNWRAEGQLKRKDGTLFDASIYTAEVRDAQGQPVGIIEIIRDTSPEKALHHHRDTFITNAAHELRGPLANLKTRLYLLKRQPEKTHEHLEVVDRAIDNMADLVNDLVDLAHFTQGELKLNQRKVELQHILRSTLSIQEPHAFQTRVDVKKSLPTHPIYIYADHQRLVQTFNNLLANAIQSTSPDGRVDLTVSLPNNGSSKWVTIQIRNNGPVLDQNHLALIFEPFFRPSEGNIKRTGMDLAISKRIIEEHGGTISVSSQPTIGTTFTIQLPVHQPETGSAAKVSEPSKSN